MWIMFFGISLNKKKGIFKEIIFHFIDMLFKNTKLYRIFSNLFIFKEPSINELREIGFINDIKLNDFYFTNANFIDTYIFSIISPESKNSELL